MRTAFPLLALTSVLAFAALTPAEAAKPLLLDDKSIEGNSRYERCLNLGKSNAQDAVTAAEAWHAEGGGAAALHCAALAFVSLHHYSEAGVKLDQAAGSVPANDRDMRVALYDQAANAWLLADQPQKAESSIDFALALAPKDEDVLFDRARARAARKNWAGADADLSTLLSLDGNRADALVLRASARHAEGRKAEASTDIARALQIYPNYPEALVERGTMKNEAGDQIGARADWEEVVRDSPDGDAGAAAKARLAELDAAAAKPQGK